MAQAWPSLVQARPRPDFGNLGTWKSRNLGPFLEIWKFGTISGNLGPEGYFSIFPEFLVPNKKISRNRSRISRISRNRPRFPEPQSLRTRVHGPCTHFPELQSPRASERGCTGRPLTTLHYITLHYTTLHYTTLHYTTLLCTRLHFSFNSVSNDLREI